MKRIDAKYGYILPIIYTILVVLSSFGIESKFYQISFLAFALLVGFLFFRAGKEEQTIKLSKWLILLPIIIILITRIVPFIGFEAPLGYDTGIYKKTIENFQEALPNLPQFPARAISANEPWGLYLSTNLLSLAGLSGNQILYGYYILLNLLLGLSIYVLVKRFFNTNAAILSLFVFALSITQFQTYWMMYYKNIAALFLMLTAFYLLKQKSWLVIPVAGFLGGVHPPTFLIFGLAMLAHFIFNKDRKYHLISGIGILAVVFSLYIPNPQAIFHFLSPDLEEMIQTLGPGAGGGTFFDFNFYRQIITFYLPFAILGLIYLIKKGQFIYLFFYFIFNFTIVYFNLIFHDRFIIHLDIIVVILSGIALNSILTKVWPNLFGKIAVVVLVTGAIYIFSIFFQAVKPLIGSEELAEIKSLSILSKKDDFVMVANSYYSPWVYGYSERKTIAPGLFEYNKWNKKEWEAFWFSSDLTLRHRLLDEYEKPIYIYTGDKGGKMDFSGDPRFERISKRIWKYE